MLVDTKLSFSQHLRSIAVKTQARCCLIFKCFLSKDPVVLYRAFVVYVRPLLEYASCSWSPCNVSGIEMVETVQRKVTKRLRGMANLDYKDRLALLDAEIHRLKIDLVTVYKILFGLLDIDYIDYFAFKPEGSTRGCSGHKYCVVENYGFVDARCNYFAVGIIKPWNSLLATTIKLTV